MDNWKPGDLALCITTSLPGRGHTTLLTRGRIYTVVFSYVSSKDASVGLVVNEAKPRVHPGFNALLFRKIHPHTPDAEDAETIRLLNRKPAFHTDDGS